MNLKATVAGRVPETWLAWETPADCRISLGLFDHLLKDFCLQEMLDGLAVHPGLPETRAPVDQRGMASRGADHQ